MPSLVQIRVPGQDPANPSESENPNGPRVYLETYGCQMNEADSSLILGQMRSAGYRRVTDPAEADLILLNTCAVREKAEDRIYGRSSQLLRYREDNPDLVIGITGCMAEHLRDKIPKRAPYVGLLAGPDNYRHIAELADRALKGERAFDLGLNKKEVYEGVDAELDPRAGDDDGISGFVTIQRGCDKFCTFCVVPFTRGRERGVPPREILRKARRYAEAGYKELTLLGQTVNSYRYGDADGEEVSFAALLRAVCQIDGIERVRFTSPYPVDFTDELIAALAEEDKLCPYVHLPVQAGSDVVLERMKRGYTKDDFRTLVAKLRAAVPDIALSTDVMVGFCGETDEDHEQTLELVREIGFDSAFMFAYSDRDITYASKKLQDDVPPEVKKARLQSVIALQEEITRQAHERYVGQEHEILIHGPSKRGDRLVGRTPTFYNVLLPLDAGTPGDFVRRKIIRSTGHSLIAE